MCTSVCTAAQAKEGLSKSDIEAALKKMPFKLGGGKTQVSLFEVVPSYAVQVLPVLCVGFCRPCYTEMPVLDLHPLPVITTACSPLRP